MRSYTIVRPFASILISAALACTLTSCGGGGGSSPSSPASVTTALSDPAPCTNQFQHVFITVSDAKAHLDPNADNNQVPDSTFADLTPGLSANPAQVDLLGPSNQTDCFLKTLGSTASLPPGQYQQIRFLLLDNAAPPNGVTPPSPNACPSGQLGANVFNCVQLADNTWHALSLNPSEIRNGIKIPPGQLQGGGLTISPGQGVNIDIDFNACMSIVRTGNGNFKLKPTLRASEVGLTPVVTGKVVLGTLSGSNVTATTQTIAGANVWLEQESHPVNTTNVENLVQTAATDSGGTFQFCPVSPGTYQIVADSDAPAFGTGKASNATITTGVNVVSSGGPSGLVVPLIADAAISAVVNGVVTTTSSTPPGTGDDVNLAALQQFSDGANSFAALVPFLSATQPKPPVVSTAATPGGGNGGFTCPAGTNCATFTLNVPSSAPVVGAASTSGSGYTLSSSTPPVNMSVDAAAFVQGTNTPVCSPAEKLSSPFNVSAGGTVTAPQIDFTGCD